MKIRVLQNPEELGKEAATLSAKIINESIAKKGKARVILSTGASQFDTLKALLDEKVDWSKVEIFHLDEYIKLPESHPASFRKYLKERFTNHINPKKAYFVNGEGDIKQNIKELTEELIKEPIDLGLIGIGMNAHLAFNDPPADFDTKEAYIVVNLDYNCKKQQVGEGWFPTVEDVPEQAISMSVYQIMQCGTIISSVPHKVKANAIKLMLDNDVTNMVPATMLKKHKDVNIFLDEESASLANKDILNQYK